MAITELHGIKCHQQHSLAKPSQTLSPCISSGGGHGHGGLGPPARQAPLHRTLFCNTDASKEAVADCRALQRANATQT